MIRRPLLPRLAREGASVLVHTADQRSIAGVLIGAHRDVLVLDAGSLLTERGEPVALDGNVAIPRAQVSFLQVDVAS